MSLIGTIGAAAFALAWIPQCLETWRRRRCDVNASFLVLNAVGSLSLAAYALLNRDAVFTGVNALTSAGALLNLYMKGAEGRPQKAKDGSYVANPVLSLTEGETKRP